MSETSISDRANDWIVGRDTGSSSKSIWAVMMGRKGAGQHPRDGDDFGRCYRLLAEIPEWRPRLNEMTPVSAYWAGLVTHWPELERLHVEKDWIGLYRRMREIIDPIRNADPKVFRMGKGVEIKFGS